MATWRSATFALAAILGGSAVAASQQQLMALGQSGPVRGIGDIDGDGHADLALRTAGELVRVLSGATQIVLYSLTPDVPGIDFALPLDTAGDVDGDGVPDIVLGAPKADVNGIDSGFVRMVSGADGSTIFTTQGAAAGDHFGVRVAGIGDASGDGVPDVAVTSAEYYAAQEHARVLVLSGADGSVLVQCGPTVDQGQFGSSICGPGDVDGDGFADVAVSADIDDAWVYSGHDGSLIHTLDDFGAGIHAVAPGGDLDADGVPDIAALALPYWTGIGRVYSGATGEMLLSVEQPSTSHSAKSFNCLGDATGDGVPDYMLGSFAEELDSMWSGNVKLVSGATGAVVYTCEEYFPVETYEDAFFGPGIPLGDVDGDGVAEFGTSGFGGPLVISGAPTPITQLPFGGAIFPTPALLAGVGTLQPNSDLALWSSKLPASSSAFLVVGWHEIDAPFKASVMVPNPAIVAGPLPINAAGLLKVHGTWPAGIPPAFPLWFQTWALDPGSPVGWRSTNAVLAKLH